MEQEDKGHIAMITDLENILDEAKQFAFHDFKNTEFATPKVVFLGRCQMMIEKCKQGEYDNTPEEQLQDA